MLHDGFIRILPRGGDRIELILNYGDLYVMSEKATGNNWKKRKSDHFKTGSRL